MFIILLQILEAEHELVDRPPWKSIGQYHLGRAYYSTTTHDLGLILFSLSVVTDKRCSGLLDIRTSLRDGLPQQLLCCFTVTDGLLCDPQYCRLFDLPGVPWRLG